MKVIVVAGWVMAAAIGGCAGKPQAKRTGFLSDYSKLEVSPSDAGKARWVSERLKEYATFEVDAVEFRMPPQKLTEKEREDVAAHFKAKFVELLQERGKSVVANAGQDEIGAADKVINDAKTARVRFALTDIAESVWIAKVHPGMRLTGAGTGGAALEAEIVDRDSGEQLAAWVYSGMGKRIDFTAFSTVADVKSAVARWMEEEVTQGWESAVTPRTTEANTP